MGSDAREEVDADSMMLDLLTIIAVLLFAWAVYRILFTDAYTKGYRRGSGITSDMAKIMASRPDITPEMVAKDLTWVPTTEGRWVMVCKVCMGNCGQCGNTSIVGNVPFNMDAIASHIERNR